MTSQLSLPWGNKTYKKIGDDALIKQLNDCSQYIPPVLNTVVRGKEITLQIDGMFMVWAAVFMEEIEPEQLDWIDSIPKGSVYYDIGAGVGNYTTYAALSGLRCFAFEPEAQNYAALEMHHCLNASRMAHPITSFNIAVSDRKRLSFIFCENYEKGAHRKILGEVDFSPKHKQSVATEPLYSAVRRFLLPAPQYIKIDVDGYELKVLDGLALDSSFDSSGLKEIFIELRENEDGAECARTLESYGFKIKSKHKVEAYDGLHNYIFSKGGD